MRYLLALLALGGVVVSALALHVHYSTETPPCSINSHWDCGVVNRGPFSTVGPVVELAVPRVHKRLIAHWPFPAMAAWPVGAVGIAGYLALLLLALARQRALTALAAMAGCCFALFLTHIEHDVLEVWCLYCVISQGIIAAMVLLSIPWAAAHGRKRGLRG